MVSSTSFLLTLSRATKIFVALFVDVGLCVFTVWFAFYLRLGEFVTLSGEPVWAVVMAVALALPIFIQLGLYRTIFRYSGWPALIVVARAVGIYGISFAALFTAWGVNGVPRTIGLIQPILLLIAIGGSRTLARYWLGGLDRVTKTELAARRVLIYGAGSAGRQLASAISNSKEMRVVGYVDDDETLNRRILDGLTIWSPKKLEALVDRFEVTDVLLAMPSVSRLRRNAILAEIQKHKVAVRTLPSVTELLQDKVTASDLRDLDIDDLLGRVSVAPDPTLLSKKIADQVVMVTGAGGSIGSELVRQIIKLQPKVLLLIEQSEFALYQIDHELEATLLGGDTKVFR
jgi:FlaA1/EpsC-like NDP-sugar epimerase